MSVRLLCPHKLPMLTVKLSRKLPHGSRVSPESPDAMMSTLHALLCCLAYAQSSVPDLQGNTAILTPLLWQEVSLTSCAPRRRQQAAQALLPLCGGPPQLRRAVPGQGVPGRHHGHAPVALLLQARQRGAACAALASSLRITRREMHYCCLPLLYLGACLQ